MLTLQDYIIPLIVLAILVVLFWQAGRFIKKLPSKTIKTLNMAGFVIAIAGGILWYLAKHTAFMYVTFIGVTIYFLFIRYDSKEEKTD
ncbi:MAG TPA: hypothetical protein VFF54_07240 [Thermodesulfobacteriota bacterium]|nr:hypothetical protein [Thermodesulfobacteriota bacterium]